MLIFKSAYGIIKKARTGGYWRRIILPYTYESPVNRVFQNVTNERVFVVTGQYVEMRYNSETGSAVRKIFDQSRYYIDDSEIDWRLGMF